MSWKSDLHLSDLKPGTRIEVTCRICGASRYAIADKLMANERFAQARLDEVERNLRCSIRHCRGRVRIALGHNHKNEAYGGGLA